MTGPTKTTSASGSRFYTWRNENYYSVTTIISGGLPKQALIYWSANQVAEYVCDNLSKVTMLLPTGHPVISNAPTTIKRTNPRMGCTTEPFPFNLHTSPDGPSQEGMNPELPYKLKLLHKEFTTSWRIQEVCPTHMITKAGQPLTIGLSGRGNWGSNQ